MFSGDPPTSNSFMRSKNCPWMSPHTVTGASTASMVSSARRSSVPVCVCVCVCVCVPCACARVCVYTTMRFDSYISGKQNASLGSEHM